MVITKLIWRKRLFGEAVKADRAAAARTNHNRVGRETDAATENSVEAGEPGKTRFCGDQTTVDRRENECVDQPMPGVVEELRRIAADKRSQNTPLRDSAHLAPARMINCKQVL